MLWVVGRNWGAHRKDLIAINGFDEDYVHAGVGEDTDIYWRLRGHGVIKNSVKNKAIVYHLYHERWYSYKTERNNARIMEQKIKMNRIKCLNGIKKIDS